MRDRVPEQIATSVKMVDFGFGARDYVGRLLGFHIALGYLLVMPNSSVSICGLKRQKLMKYSEME